MTVDNKPRLIVVAGPNGSGKTAITEQLLRHTWMDGCEYINPDNIARDKYGDWNSPEAVLSAARDASEIRHKCLAEKRSVAFETVLSTSEKIDFLREAKAAGFFVRLFFIGTDNPVINAKRVAKRVMQGGHDVPIPKIVIRYTRSLANCAVAAKIADRAYIYDNSVDDVPARLLFRASDGQVVKRYEQINAWATEIARNLVSATAPDPNRT